MDNSDKIPIVYDTDLKRPACALLQAAMGGSTTALHRYFDSQDWLVAPTPGMRLIGGTHEEWLKAAEITKKHRKEVTR